MTGEISLTGELKSVARIEQRIAEASRLGFKCIITPKFRKELKIPGNIKVVPCSNLEEAVRTIFREKSN